MNVANILKGKGSDIVTADITDTVNKVAITLTSNKIGALLVMDDAGNMAGVLSERDIVRAMSGAGDGCIIQRAGEIMTKDVITCKPTDTIDEVMGLMTDKRIRHLPVMEGGELTGFISIGDVVKARMDAVEREAAAMRDYIATG